MLPRARHPACPARVRAMDRESPSSSSSRFVHPFPENHGHGFITITVISLIRPLITFRQETKLTHRQVMDDLDKLRRRFLWAGDQALTYEASAKLTGRKQHVHSRESTARGGLGSPSLVDLLAPCLG
jgi:hypothetical protein